tara:strand:+ start:28 stop:1539 length:1512 start_codon:yes stop_codon:yes gene_type:complete
MASFVLVAGSCSNEGEDSVDGKSIKGDHLESARLKIIDGQNEEAITELEALNRRHPDSVEVIDLLGLACTSNKEYAQAARWYLQAAELKAGDPAYLLKAGECRELAGDDKEATRLYAKFKQLEPANENGWRKLFHLLVKRARKAELKATRQELESQAIETYKKHWHPTPSEKIMVASLHRNKGFINNAKKLLKEVASDRNSDQAAPALLELLDIDLEENNVHDAERMAQKLNKEFPGAMDESPLAGRVKNLLADIYGPTFAAQRIDWENQTVEKLFQLIGETTKEKPFRPGKHSPVEVEATPLGIDEATEEDSATTANSSNDSETNATGHEESSDDDNTSVADIFLRPPPTDNLAEARQAINDGNFTLAKEVLMDVINSEPDNAKARHLLSRTHLLADEAKEAEVVGREAVRLAPQNLEIRLFYLQTARPPILTPQRFIQKLERASQDFPESLDLILLKAEHYHSEKNYNAASVLYRQFLQMAPLNEPRRETIQRELAALGNP